MRAPVAFWVYTRAPDFGSAHMVTVLEFVNNCGLGYMLDTWVVGPLG